MHVLHFYLKVKEKTTIQKLIALFDENDKIATTDKINANEVFSFGRDHGHFGRILNQTVISVPSLNVRNGNEVIVNIEELNDALQTIQVINIESKSICVGGEK